jgi:hypothetical protein
MIFCGILQQHRPEYGEAAATVFVFVALTSHMKLRLG